MNQNPFIQFLLNKAMNDPRIANDPTKRHFLDVVMSGNAEEGQAIANNLCRTYGTTPENASNEARKFFHI